MNPQDKSIMPSVSVITPVLNGEKYITETLDSIKSQSYGNIEHIVVDGGSTDGTVKILREYPDINLLEGSDKGMYDAINKGLDIAQGDVLAYLNCDDLYYPDTIKRSVEFFTENPGIDMIYGDLDLIDDASRFIAHYRCPDFNLKLFASIGWILSQPTFFWRRRVCDVVGKFNPDLKLLGDYEFFLRVGKKCKIQRISGLYACFRTHSHSLTATCRDQRKKEISMIETDIHNDIERFTNPVELFMSKLGIKVLNTPMYIQKLIYQFKYHM
ncbi:MAG: glycosyltransferase family 2 protein [Syntrophales bacterium]